MTKNNMFSKDIKDIVLHSAIDWDLLSGKGILVTGATGIIGYALICLLLDAEIADLKIYALTRKSSYAEKVFDDYKEQFGKKLFFLASDICEPIQQEGIDYIVHGAAMTSSMDFVRRPVETMVTTLDGTKNILEYARMKDVKKVIFLSTMEVYGYPEKGHKVVESEVGFFETTNVRNSYPLSKLVGEMLCMSYYNEYGIDINILRLSQTLGPNVKEEDKRFFAYLLTCIKNKENVVLKSKGETERSYLYSLDAATAIIYSSLFGNSGEIFNVANGELYCSIYDFAQNICNKYGLKLVLDEGNKENNGYADTLYMDLDTTKIEKIGWKPSSLCIEDIYDRMV